MDAPTDERLLAGYLADGDSGFETLVHRHTRELHQFVLRFTHSSAAADDVVQEAFLQVHLSAASFDPSRRFKPWLFTIAANKARDWLRSRSRRSEVPLDARVGGDQDGERSFADLLAGSELPAEQEVSVAKRRRAVREVVEQMPDHLREVLVLAYFHRFPYQEMADVLGVPLGTIKSRLHAAVGHFARRYKGAVGTGGGTADPLEQEAWEEP